MNKDFIKTLIDSGIDADTLADVLALACGTAKPETPTPSDSRPVVVCTEKRGVFFGYTTDSEVGTVRLRDCQNCYYWAAGDKHDEKGIMGLAISGPVSGSKISAPVPGITTINLVTAIIPCTEAAANKWGSASW